MIRLPPSQQRKQILLSKQTLSPPLLRLPHLQQMLCSQLKLQQIAQAETMEVVEVEDIIIADAVVGVVADVCLTNKI